MKPAASAPPRGWREPWSLVPLVAAIALTVHAWFPFIGEPVADDFDFLHDTFLSGRGDWLDGGGSRYYWRPLARQLYYRVFGGLMLMHPHAMSVVEAALAALAGLLLYHALRRRWPATWSAAAASFPLLLEAGRPLVSCPTNFQDLGAILFSALALYEASRARLIGALGALLAALLCKEMAAVTALALPFVAPQPAEPIPRAHARRRWAFGAGAVVVAWGIAYGLVVRHAGLLLARDAVEDPRALATPWLVRFLWACRESLADAMSLPALTPMRRTAAILTLAAMAGWIAVTLITDRKARQRVRAQWPWIAGGLAWFTLATATLADVFPDWRPYRSPYGAMGIGVAATAFLGALQPALLAALVGVRLATFALSPGPPAVITVQPPGGYSIDFPKLVRLQRLVGETRRELAKALPRPAPGTGIATHYYPQGALYAFAGDRSVQTWYGDTTLHWVTVEAPSTPSPVPASVVVEFQPTPPRQVAIVSAEMLWYCDLAAKLIDRQRWDVALGALARADSLQQDPGARLFASMVAGKRALALSGLERMDESDREAARALTLWAANDDARYAKVLNALRTSRLADAETMLDTLVRSHPRDPMLNKLMADTRRARAGAGR